MTEEERFGDLLGRELAGICALSRAQISELYGHYRLLVRWNRVLNLSSVVDLAEAVSRHYCESVLLAAHLPDNPGAVLDFGSGGGFPGVPVAIVRSRGRVTLAESHQRKAVFLREATRHLPNVTVAARRAEDVSGRFEWVISRAVRWPEVLGSTRERVALLLGAQDASMAARDGRMRWNAPVPLPWGRERVLLLGERKGTAT
jgi:16S rRNA (guanine527-N7)-methyltransferase